MEAVRLENAEGCFDHLYHDQKAPAPSARGWQQECHMGHASFHCAIGRWGYPNRGIMDDREQPCQSFMENKAFEDEMRFWHSLLIVQLWTLDQILVKISLGVIHLFICFEVFLSDCILLFLLEWNTKQNLPDIQTALLMSPWPTPWL